MSHSLQPCGLQHTRLSYPTLSTRACSNSCSLSGWCHPNTSFSAAPFSSCPHLSQHQGLFHWVCYSNQVAKYWKWSFSFSISPSSEYSGLISFIFDWFDLFAVQETLKSFLQHCNFKSINFSVLSLLYGPALTSICDYWKSPSFNYKGLCWQSDVSAF